MSRHLNNNANIKPMSEKDSAFKNVLAYNGLKRKLTNEEDVRAKKVVGQFRLLSLASVVVVITLIASAFLSDKNHLLDAYVLITRFSALLIPIGIVYLTQKTMRAYRERPYALLEVNEQAISFCLSISRISFPWKSVKLVQRKEKSVEVHAKGDRLMLIPTSLFKNLKEADKFVEAANVFLSGSDQ